MRSRKPGGGGKSAHRILRREVRGRGRHRPSGSVLIFTACTGCRRAGDGVTSRLSASLGYSEEEVKENSFTLNLKKQKIGKEQPVLNINKREAVYLLPKSQTSVKAEGKKGP